MPYYPVKRITLKEAQKQARLNGMTIRKTSAGDYRVSFKGGSESRTVYESSIQDALDTAHMMYKYKHGLR
jgi:hypothetical protein